MFLLYLCPNLEIRMSLAFLVCMMFCHFACPLRRTWCRSSKASRDGLASEGRKREAHSIMKRKEDTNETTTCSLVATCYTGYFVVIMQ